MPDNNDKILEIFTKLQEITHICSSMNAKQMEIHKNIAKIKEAIYNPTDGLYARIRPLEEWRKISLKIIWLITTILIGGATMALWKAIITIQ